MQKRVFSTNSGPYSVVTFPYAGLTAEPDLQADIALQDSLTVSDIALDEPAPRATCPEYSEMGHEPLGSAVSTQIVNSR